MQRPPQGNGSGAATKQRPPQGNGSGAAAKQKRQRSRGKAEAPAGKRGGFSVPACGDGRCGAFPHLLVVAMAKAGVGAGGLQVVRPRRGKREGDCDGGEGGAGHAW